MCNPVAMAVAGGAQAALGNMAAADAATARNRQRARLHRHKQQQIIREHNANITHYYHKFVDAEISWSENAMAANRAANIEQMKLNQGIAEAFKASETNYIEMVQSKRVAASLEKTGVSARRVSTAMKAELGRRTAASSAKQSILRDRAMAQFHAIAAEKRKSDRRAYMAIGAEPMRGREPPKPVFDKGPSVFAQLAGVALGAAGGYVKGKQMFPQNNPGNLPPTGGSEGDFLEVPDSTWDEVLPGGDYSEGHYGYLGGGEVGPVRNSDRLLSDSSYNLNVGGR